jgi:D-alanyl-D-alanine carboxypeptidase
MDNVLGYENFQFIQEEILMPLNLKNTLASLNEVNIDRCNEWLSCRTSSSI